MTPINNGYFAVPILEDAQDFKVIEDNLLHYKASYGSIADVGRIYKLPPGKWEFVCTTKDITEEQAEEIHGLLRSLSLTGNYAIIKKL